MNILKIYELFCQIRDYSFKVVQKSIHGFFFMSDTMLERPLSSLENFHEFFPREGMGLLLLDPFFENQKEI